MDILIAGGSGFIGKHLTAFLIQEGHKVTVLTRSIQKVSSEAKRLEWDGKTLETNLSFDIIINLCGQNIASKRWSQKRKCQLLASRIDPTKAIVSYIKNIQSTVKPRLLNASAIGYYPSSNEIQTEENPASSKQSAFSRELVSKWESCAKKANEYGSQVSCLRFSVALGRDGGMLKKILPPFKLGLGTVIGNKSAYSSWIHIDDLCRAIQFIILLKQIKPTYNLSSPTPCTQLSLATAIATSCHRKCFLRLPEVFVYIIFGEMGKELLLANQKILPKNLVNAGFEFKYKNINSAINNLLQK
ncbi:MAG: TIGR01777 family oxidoreductase [Gammaproteobacteria bacterium]|nr:TIGR01777 family oxidoreductase [Gammaproteobacteria bacterium]